MMKLGAKNTADLVRIVMSRRQLAQSGPRSPSSEKPASWLSA